MSNAYKVAYNTWQEKTEWVQTDRRFDVLLPWGKHRADVLKEYIERLEYQVIDLAVQLANAESKCRELAAENAGLKELIEQHANSVAVCPNCSHEEPSETDDIVELYRSMEAPATDAFLAEVRAQGVEMFAMCIAHRVNYSEVDKSIELDALSFAEGLRNQAPELSPEYVVELAAQLRKGAAL